MNKWRVGTLSMGLSLLMLGVFLFISQFFGYDVFMIAAAWWPLILIVLGIEILLYLFLSTKDHPKLKYDFLSILFISFLGFVGIGLTLFYSLGITEEVQGMIKAEKIVMDLPEIKMEVPSNIKQIIIDASNNITIEGTNKPEIRFFGIVNTTSRELYGKITKEDLMSTHLVGDIMYVIVKPIPQKEGPFATYNHENGILIVPDDVEIEIRSKGAMLDLYPKDLKNKWSVDNTGTTRVYLDKDSQVTLDTTTYQIDRNDSWDTIDTIQLKGNNVLGYKAIKKIGEGTYLIHILHSNMVQMSAL